jgi:hypothetical protein
VHTAQPRDDLRVKLSIKSPVSILFKAARSVNVNRIESSSGHWETI